MLATMQRNDETTVQDTEDAQNQEYIFPHGLAGFSEDHRYGMIYPGHGDCICLQSLNNTEAAFIMTPWDQSRLDLPPALRAEDMQLLELLPGDVPIWMLVLNPFVDPDWVTANLRAPIVINERARIAMQLIRSEEKELRFPWMRQPERHERDEKQKR